MTDGGPGMNYLVFGVHGVVGVALLVFSTVQLTEGNIPGAITLAGIAGMVFLLGWAAGRLAARTLD